MFEPKVLPNDAGELSATLEIDMAEYCKACIQLYRAEEPLRRQYELAHPKALEMADASYLYEQDKYVKQKVDSAIQKTFDDARGEISGRVSGIFGGEHWNNVKKALAGLCDLANANEKLLAKELEKIGNKPAAIQMLDTHSVEFLKNSLDALIIRFMRSALEGVHQNTTLQMRFSVKRPITEAHLDIKVADNAGGFPSDYIPSFNKFVNTLQNYPEIIPIERHQSEKAHGNPFRKYCFGGEGAGMFNCCAELFAIEKDSSMAMENITNPDGSRGAETAFISTFSAPLPHRKASKSDEDEDEDDGVALSSASRSPSSLFTLSPLSTRIPENSPLVTGSIFQPTEGNTAASASKTLTKPDETTRATSKNKGKNKLGLTILTTPKSSSS